MFVGEITHPTDTCPACGSIEGNFEKVKKSLTIKNTYIVPRKIEFAHIKTEVTSKQKSSEIKSAITLTIYPKIIELKIPKDEADIQFIRSFKYAKWNSNQYRWTVPNYGRNADLLKSYFSKKSA